MNNISQLPNGYGEIFSVNIQKDKKISFVINMISVLIMAGLFVLGNAVVPITQLFDMSDGMVKYFIRFAAMIIGMVIYIFLHECIHGVCMKCFGAKNIKYGFTGLYAYAGCDYYFCKKAYIIIALAPIVVWGIVLLIANLFVSSAWFWVVYFIQIMNISGAAGDLYVTYKFSRMPKDILVHDTGIEMKVYSR